MAQSDVRRAAGRKKDEEMVAEQQDKGDAEARYRMAVAERELGEAGKLAGRAPGMMDTHAAHCSEEVE